MTRIEDKIKEIGSFIDELKAIVPADFNSYKSSIEKKAACERYVEKIVEAATDLAFLVIKAKKLRIPQDDIDAFNIILESRIIGKELASRLKNAKGMRNIISHQYCAVDDRIVFEAIRKELGRDATEFARIIGKSVKKGN